MHGACSILYSMFNVGSLVKSRIGERYCPIREKGFDTGGVKNSKLFEELATSSWNLAAGVATPERGTGASQLTFYESINIERRMNEFCLFTK